ncbi:HNH endonuclease, partial [Pantoea brenneri]|uniref:HNH endonuclease n=3 Tax=Pantoea TaxID=53335 RepID=UPI0028EF094E
KDCSGKILKPWPVFVDHYTPGWQVHHKIPLDDSGTNALNNLILIQNSPYHSALSKTQAIITKDLPYNASTNVLWPSPNGVIYPVGK